MGWGVEKWGGGVLLVRMNGVVDIEAGFSVEAVREDFPILGTLARGKPLVYLDNAASVQKPRQVIEAMGTFYGSEYANIHRGLHHLSEAATRRYEDGRKTVARFLGVGDAREIVFTRGATESINLVAQSFLRSRLKPGDTILVTGMEHHANIVPWQMVAGATGARLEAIPVLENGELDVEAGEVLLERRPAMFAFVHVSNALGTVNPAKVWIEKARACGVPVLLDGAQSVPHFRVDLGDLKPDFFVFSGHKVYGPSGIGVLYGRYDLLAEMPPYQGGGDMIDRVSFAGTTFTTPPARFEAGTPHIAGAVGLAAACEYLEGTDRAGAEAHEDALLERIEEGLDAIAGVRRMGHAADRAGAASFVVEGVHPHDLATFLDQAGVAVRAGHHCTQPLMERFGVPATTRASVAMYNTFGEVEVFLKALERTISILG